MAIVKRQVGFDSGLRLRDTGEGEGPSRVIEGYALKFGVRSKLLSDWWAGAFYEVLEPGSLTRETLDDCDIKLTMFHDRELILARSKQGAGTLSYDVDDVGVRFWAEMPNTDDGNKALELVQRGDIDGCSFIYSTNEKDNVRYERLSETDAAGDPVLLRHVSRIDKVYDFTVTPDPAFEQTTVSRREVEAAGLDVGEPEQVLERETPAEPETREPETPAIDWERKRAIVKGLRDAALGRS